MTDAWRHQRMSRAQTLTFWLLFLAVIFAPLQASAATLTGKVVKVADGDTITILVGTERHRVRLQGIDAPRAQAISTSCLMASSAKGLAVAQSAPLPTTHHPSSNASGCAPNIGVFRCRRQKATNGERLADSKLSSQPLKALD